MKTKIKALVQYLDCKKEEITVSSYDENVFEYGDKEYLVVTDDEANQLWDEDLDNYIEEFILPQLESVRLTNYFDEDSWKEDARQDGRGHSLNRYDGSEITEEVDEELFYIYRQN